MVHFSTIFDSSVNVGGEIDERERFWLQSCASADVIFYLIDLEKLLNHPEETKRRIKSDFKWIAENISNFKADSVIHILINKSDIILNKNHDPEEVDSYILSELSGHMEEIEEILKKILGMYFDKVTGVSPISMIDKSVFNRCFSAVLQSVFKSKG